MDFRNAFIEFALARHVIRFGSFTLKSGRQSPYFFNAGAFKTGGDMAQLGRFYADCIQASGLEFDVLFGPAYKGIPLATATAIALAREHGNDVPFCFNRKEKKEHGEGGNLVGAPLHGRVLIVDDVITAGTAIRESMALITAHGATAAGVVVALDRQEKGHDGLSAIQEVERDFGIPVVPIVHLDDLAQYLRSQGNTEQLKALEAYRERYGIDRND